ncbi:hypothetical protein [Azovibrio restrictus]|uniref:hypothetical protein n=1 Tax=Azovibrio restrictus TaxID=146938 RepID=UPI0026E98E3C|nr:hypothetical protein [Azovibrio restrictus]
MIEILVLVAVLAWLAYGLWQDARAGRLAPEALRADIADMGGWPMLALLIGLVVFLLVTGIVGLIALVGFAAVWRVIWSFMR